MTATVAGAAEIANLLAQDVGTVAKLLLPDGKLDHGQWVVGSTAGEPGQSLKLRVTGGKAGLWKDFATEQCGDLLTLWRETRGLSMIAAMDECRAYLGLRNPYKDKDGTGQIGQLPPRVPVRAASPPADDDEDKRKRELAREIWIECVPLVGSLGEAYFRRRACVIPKPDADVKFHPALYCTDVKAKRPAIVCRVSTVVGNCSAGIHRLFLDPAGADRATTKKRLGGCDEPVCIRLYPDDEVTQSLAITEGVESALAAARLHAPAWSALNAGNLTRFPVLGGIENLVIFADHDEAGIKAARACAERWEAAGRHVVAVTANAVKADVNDLVREAVNAG